MADTAYLKVFLEFFHAGRVFLCTLPFLTAQNKKVQWEKKKLAASSMLHEAKIAYYAFDVIVYCMYTHQTRTAYTKRTH